MPNSYPSNDVGAQAPSYDSQRISYSKVDCWQTCRYKFYLKYLQGMKTSPLTFDSNAREEASNALVLGTCMDIGIQHGTEEALEKYRSFFPLLDDPHQEEMWKLSYFIPRARALVPEGMQYQVEIVWDKNVGILDGLLQVSENEFDLYDWKYSNNTERYLNSAQLDFYKWLFETFHKGKKRIRNMFYLMVPKLQIKPYDNKKFTEDLPEFRRRMLEELKGKEPTLVQVKPGGPKWMQFLEALGNVQVVRPEWDFIKSEGPLCNYCEYKHFCKNGAVWMQLPKNEKRNIETVDRVKLWIYGASFTGKTTFANQFPNALMINTDGNYKFVNSPVIHVKNEHTKVGKLDGTIYGWDTFLEILDELAKKNNTYETIVFDLVEDLCRMSRQKICKSEGVEHESEGKYGKVWDKTKNGYLDAMYYAANLPYNIVFISHEDMSRDITRPSGEQITSVRPNIKHDFATKISGMVDIVARCVVRGGEHYLTFQQDEVVFGGGRLKDLRIKEIPLKYEALMDVYKEASKRASARQAPKEASAQTVPEALAEALRGIPPTPLDTSEVKAQAQRIIEETNQKIAAQKRIAREAELAGREAEAEAAADMQAVAKRGRGRPPKNRPSEPARSAAPAQQELIEEEIIPPEEGPPLRDKIVVDGEEVPVTAADHQKVEEMYQKRKLNLDDGDEPVRARKPRDTDFNYGANQKE